MKYLIISFLTLLISYPKDTFGKPKVLATCSIWADMASVIGSELIELDYIVPIGSDPHLYEPTPSDLLKVQNADIILINGLTFEGWLNKLIMASSTKAHIVTISEGIKVIQNEIHQNAVDPHAWMDVNNAIVYCKNILSAFVKAAPLNSKEFEFNFNIYKKELETLNNFVIEKISSIPESKRILITSHDGFRYFGKAYGLKLEPLQGTSTESDVQSKTILHINTIIKKYKIPAIFAESTINPKLLHQIKNDNNIQIGGKLYADSLGDPLGEASTYIKMMKSNTETIAKGLNLSLSNSNMNSSSDNFSVYFGIALFYIISLGLLIFINRK